MLRVAKHVALVAGLLLAGSTAAQAHRIWIEPSTFTLSGEEQWITVDAAVSNDLFRANHVPLSLKGMTVTAPDGSTVPVENGHQGKLRSTFDVKLDRQGTWRIAETGDTFFATWMENGERQRRRGDLAELRKAGIQDKQDAKFTQSVRRVETFVTLGAPSELKPRGQGLELAPVTHPNDIVAGEPAQVKMLLNGKPAAGLKVTIVKADDQYRDTVEQQELVTGEDGALSFSLDRPGRYWLTAQTRDTTTVEGMEMDRMVNYSATFEAAAP